MERGAPPLRGQHMNIARVVGAAVMLLSGSAAAQDGGKVIQKTTINLGTATPGGGFPAYGNAFAEIMNAADPTLWERAEVRGYGLSLVLAMQDQ